uniref:Uncharacterized protein n=1 Tax=Nothobranchius kuhntae TaxID=321403 RepID=A0A1A8JJ78_NOTKU
MKGLIQFSNKEQQQQKKKQKKIPAKQYFDLLVFIICILYLVTVTITNVTDLQADSSLGGAAVMTLDSAALSPFLPTSLQFILMGFCFFYVYFRLKKKVEF